MLNLEDSIEDVISKKLVDGTIEKLIQKNLESGINKVLEDLLGHYGDVSKVLEDKIKSVMIPYLESYDYSKYIVKLDDVMVDVLKSSTEGNRKILENFKELMTFEKEKKTITVTELFKKWTDYVTKNVSTSELEVNCDDGSPSYEYVDVTFEVEYDEERDWGSFKNANLVFECEKDEDMNLIIRLQQYKNNPWSMSFDNNHDIKSIRYLNELQIFMMKLEQFGTDIEIDEESGSDEIEVEAEPEADFS